MKARSPVLGYNHNVRYAGRLWHVQTEDSGVNNPHVFTHLFHDGTILATKRLDYDPSSEVGVVQKLMQAQHKALLRELKAGVFDEKITKFFGQPVVREQEPAAESAPPPAIEMEADAADEEGLRLVGPPTDPSLQAIPAVEDSAAAPAPATDPNIQAPAPPTDPTLKPQSAPPTDPTLKPTAPPTTPPPMPAVQSPSGARPAPPPRLPTGSRPAVSPSPQAARPPGTAIPSGPRPTIPPPPTASSTPSRTSVPPPPPRSSSSVPRVPSPNAPRVATSGIGGRRNAQTPPAGVATRPTAEGVVVARPAVIIGGDSTARRENTQPRAPGQPSSAKRWQQSTAAPEAQKPPTSENIFGADLISEKSLDEVILAYLSEDLNEK
jgi:hypothetical protein